jgi:hypothetical protein
MNSQVEDIKREISRILLAHGVIRAAVFGSFARGESTRDSDIDLLVEFAPGKSLLDLAGLQIELARALNRSVDVVTYGSLHPLLKNRILSEQEVIL